MQNYFTIWSIYQWRKGSVKLEHDSQSSSSEQVTVFLSNAFIRTSIWSKSLSIARRRFSKLVELKKPTYNSKQTVNSHKLRIC